MLETLDPGNRPAAADASDAAAGRAGAERAGADRHACDGRAAGGDEEAALWSGNWLQLSHELRTPLNAILGNIELLLDGSAGPLAAPVRACVGDIQMASRELLRQLQPLLLLVQARTAGAPATGLPIDLLALLRQVADPAGAADRGRPGQDQRGAPHLPEGACLMVPGDPIWLGVLAAALVDLHAAAPAEGPLAIVLEQPRLGDGGVVLRASWPGLDPAATSPLPLALIDAVLALHGGRICSLSADGLRLDLPDAAVVASNRSGRERR
jgi:His Kinase A (phospho-acceptor) domain